MRNDERLRTIYEVMAPYIVRNEHNWRDYLAFASQFHKHSFDNILLVYAQDEDVSILATRKQWATIPGAAEGFGLQWESISTDDPQAVVDTLASGKLIVALMSKGHFTSSGHFMVLRGVTSEGKILVADPASKKRSEQEWDISIILDEARKGAAAGGPLWAIY